ncbi:hypothetical protein [Kitasatospora sp. NPDC088351]
MTDQPAQPAPLHVFLSDVAEQALAALRPGELDAATDYETEPIT